MKKQVAGESVLRISLGSLVMGLLGLIVLVLGSGFAASRLFPPRPSLINTEGREQLLSTVQEITISPNQAAAATLATVERSVILLTEGRRTVGVGVVVTNDGLVVTADTTTLENVVAYDYRGQEVSLEYLGPDRLFGLTYLRITDGVLPTIDLQSGEVSPATELMLITRNETTYRPRAAPFDVLDTTLPPELTGRGIQRMIRGATERDEQLAGSPLVDESGKLSALLLRPSVGLALPADLLRYSLSRVSAGQREHDPLTELGIDIDYTFVRRPTLSPAFGVEIISVAAGSPAAAGGFKRGDIIIALGGEELPWNRSVIEALGRPRPLTLTVRRGERDLELTIN